MSKPIIIVSNTPLAPTGYGQQTKQLAQRIKADGIPVGVAANYGAPTNMEVEGIQVFAEGLIKYANDSGPENIAMAASQGGFGLTLFDVWVAINEAYHHLPIVAWVPIDHDPVPPRVAEWCIKGGNKLIVAMSKHGEQALLKAGVPRDRLTYIPHAIDTKVWTHEGATCRDVLRVPEDAHLTVITAMNKGKRKSFPEMLKAWALFAQQHDDAYLYLHTDRWGHLDGINLIPVLKAVGAPEDRIRWVNSSQMRAGIPAETLAAIMRSANVLLLASRGEGFGIPVIEAQACGTPVIVTDWTAQPELVRDHGYVCEGQEEWDEMQESWWKIPSVESILEGLTLNYIATQAGEIDRAALAAKMYEYDADYVYTTKWQPLFADIFSGKIKLGAPAEQPVALNRAQRRKAK
jgi:glycosyltransferase involved in cell wall biosynthesis